MLKQWLNARFSRLVAESNENELKIDRLSQKTSDYADLILNELYKIQKSQQLILDRLNTLEAKTMSQLDELLLAQEEGGKIIVKALNGLTDLSTTISAETADVATTLKQIQEGQLPLSALAPVIAKVQEQNKSLALVTEGITKASDSVQAIVPTIITPEVPSIVPAPTVEPLPPAPDLEVVPAPTKPTDIVIEPTPVDVGFENVPAIDVAV